MNVKDLTKNWLMHRKHTISELNRLAGELDKHTSNFQTANMVGLAASVVGGVFTVGCLAAIPFTGGVSIIGAGVAAGAGISGGTVSLGSAILKHLIDSDIIHTVQSAIDEDRRITEYFMKKVQEALEDPEFFLEGVRRVVGFARFAAEIAKCADKGIIVLEMAGRVSKILGVVGSVLTVASLPWQIKDLIQSIDGDKNTDSDVARNIRNNANELEIGLKVVSQAYNKSL